MDSLIATELIQRIGRELGAAPQLSALLRGASAAQVAEEIAASLSADEPAGEQEEFLF